MKCGDKLKTIMIVEDEKTIRDELKNMLNQKIKLIIENIKLQPEVAITYYVPDNKKSGGVYKTISGNVKKIDEVEKCIIFTNKLKIFFLILLV